jgi:ParB/RepB/Spo0J family partition protein
MQPYKLILKYIKTPSSTIELKLGAAANNAVNIQVPFEPGMFNDLDACWRSIQYEIDHLASNKAYYHHKPYELRLVTKPYTRLECFHTHAATGQTDDILFTIHNPNQMKMIETKEMKLEDLFPAEYNNRKAWSKDQMTELVSSVKQRGVLVPLIVREGKKAGKYEVVCGFRRFTAATEAGLKLVPCSIRQMTDEEAYELMIIENLQREDIHPLDEGQAFVLLSKTNTADQIATKIHKHKSYVIKRMKLASSLVEEGKKLFYEQAMNYSQALIISRLQEADQKKTIRENMKEQHDGAGKPQRYLAHEKDLMSYISKHFMLIMAKAVFDLEDPELVKNAGPCSICPKRTKNSPNLFDDMSKDDRCTDPDCFSLKEKRHFEQKAEQLKQKEGKVLTATMDYHDKLVIGDKRVTPVSKKDYPDATPVLVTGAQSSFDSERVKGKVLYVRADLKDPAPPKPSKAEAAKSEKDREKKRSEQSVKDKCLAFTQYLMGLLWNKLTKPGFEFKPSKEMVKNWLKAMTEFGGLGSDEILFLQMIIESDGKIVPKKGQDAEAAFKESVGMKNHWYGPNTKESKTLEAAKAKAIDRLAKLPFINAVTLSYLGQWADHNANIDPKSEFAQALAELKIDVKAEKERFSKYYDAQLRAQQAPKIEKKEPEGKKPAQKKEAAKTPAKKKAGTLVASNIPPAKKAGRPAKKKA